MKFELSPEQTAYLKGVESKKKQRKFLLDCMIEQITQDVEVKSEFKTNLWHTVEEKYELEEKNHLCWIYNRLLFKHKEKPLFDYMHKLREIALKFDESANHKKHTDNQPVILDKEQIDNNEFKKTKRPPLGVKPLWLHNYLRLQEINDAIRRYEFVNKQIPDEWIVEKQTLEPRTYDTYKPEGNIAKEFVETLNKMDDNNQSANEKSEELCCMCKIHKKEENSNRCISCNGLLKHLKDTGVYPLGSRQLINQSANDELKSKLEKAFNASREYHHTIVDSVLKNKLVYNNFEEYYKTLNL